MSGIKLIHIVWVMLGMFLLVGVRSWTALPDWITGIASMGVGLLIIAILVLLLVWSLERNYEKQLADDLAREEESGIDNPE